MPPPSAPLPPPPWPPPPEAPAGPIVLQPSPDPILVELPERADQRRWTVLLRLFLLIPILVVTVVVGIAVVVCAVVGWFAALITGRAPNFLRSIVTVGLRFDLRLHAYAYLLTDRFPPFSFDEVPEFPVALAVPPATKLNRWAVLFRYVLAIPAGLLVTLVENGVIVLNIYGWFAALITGRLPKPLHDAFRAFIRYQARLTGYFFLLVPTYPEALFGEEPAPVDQGVVPVSVPPRVPEGTPARWRLVLNQGAKRVLVAAIIIGVPIWITGLVLNAQSASQNSNQQAMVQANNQLVDNLNQFTSTANRCTDPTCLEQANQVLTGQLAAFLSAMQSDGAGGVPADIANQMTDAVQSAEDATSAVAQAGSSPAEFRAVVAQTQVVQKLNALAAAQQRFVAALNNA